MQSIEEDENLESLVVQGELLELEVKRLLAGYDNAPQSVVQK